jgi:hypothetical protein
VNKEKRQIWLDSFTTTDYASEPTSDGGWNEAEVTSTITETEEIVTTTIYTERPHHPHTTKKPAPCKTPSNNLDTTLYLEFPPFNKRQTFSATLELSGPADTDFLSFYPSETTNGGEDVPCGSWYPLQTWMPS